MSMAFWDIETRDAFFSDHKVCVLGTAMSHVNAVNLGVWGSEDALAEDAAKILLREIAGLLDTYVRNEAIWAAGRAITPKDIRRTDAFREGFEMARGRNRKAVADGLAGLNSALAENAKWENERLLVVAARNKGRSFTTVAPDVLAELGLGQRRGTSENERD